MSLMKMFSAPKKASAKLAKDRLTLILAHERTMNVPYLSAMKEEILQVIQKYTNAQKVEFKTNSHHNSNTLEVEILIDK